ncbi:MAG: hypothetical protein O7H41_21970 [Planctomycetota bacterium]|nr:hypothetical protein [Planctomycetota bacterium]
MFDRFTLRALTVLGFARQEALRLKHEYIGTEHILLGLLREGGGRAAMVLKILGQDPNTIQAKIETIAQPGTLRVRAGNLPITKQALMVLELSVSEAVGFGHTRVGSAHVLLGLIGEGEGVAGQVLQSLGVSADAVRKHAEPFGWQ